MVYTRYIPDIWQLDLWGIYRVYVWHMTFVLNSAAPARGRNALEMLRDTGFWLQGCLLFCTQRGGAIGHPGLGLSESVGPGQTQIRPGKICPKICRICQKICRNLPENEPPPKKKKNMPNIQKIQKHQNMLSQTRPYRSGKAGFEILVFCNMHNMHNMQYM
jgi:hypothetical protein